MEIVAPKEWYAVLDLLSHAKGLAILLGATDTGKTTFAGFVIDGLCQRKIKAALVDADIGQSSLGPPTTIGLHVFESPPKGDSLSMTEIFFVGSNTPEENIPLHLDGVKRMVDRAVHSGAEVILVDTTGLVQGDLGKELKRKKIDLLSPRFLFALQRSGELEHILEIYGNNPHIKIYRLAPSEYARTRSREERKAYRTRKFQEYFKDADPQEVVLEGIELEGKVTTSNNLFISLEWALWIKRLLVGLSGINGDTLALGVIENFVEERKVLKILTPLRTLEKVKTIYLSSLKLTPSYEEERI